MKFVKRKMSTKKTGELQKNESKKTKYRKTKTKIYNTQVGQMNSGGKQSERMSHSDALQ